LQDRLFIALSSRAIFLRRPLFFTPLQADDGRIAAAGSFSLLAPAGRYSQSDGVDYFDKEMS
jgi:hypothetical protein